MPVRLRITLLFSLLVAILLGLVCIGIYIFSVNARTEMVSLRLKNRAITTGRFLSRNEIFTREVVQRIDSFTTMSLSNKLVQAYDHKNELYYNHKDKPAETFVVSEDILNKARFDGVHYFIQNKKDAVAYYHKDSNILLVIVAAGEDVEGHKNLADLKQILILSFLVGTLITLAAGYFFSGRLLRPVRKITKDVAEISAQNLTRRLPTYGVKDEWYNLADTLNELLNRLQESFDMQRRFIANASHEMSTPLTSISSQLQVALMRERSAEEYRQVIQSTYQDVKHMNRLTHTLLEFAKASGNTGGLELANIRVDEIILELPAQLIKMNPAYSAVIDFEALPEEDEKLVVYGNKPLLETAIKNIVVNACKYSPDHQAAIRLETRKATISISIEDKGEGIPPDQIKTIFQPFYRIENNTARSTDGFGLGLSLSYRIIRLHKGEIHVKSTLNKGSIFQIDLPVAG